MEIYHLGFWFWMGLGEVVSGYKVFLLALCSGMYEMGLEDQTGAGKGIQVVCMQGKYSSCYIVPSVQKWTSFEQIENVSFSITCCQACYFSLVHVNVSGWWVVWRWGPLLPNQGNPDLYKWPQNGSRPSLRSLLESCTA